MKIVIHKIINAIKSFFRETKNFFASIKFHDLLFNKNIRKAFFVIVLVIIMMTESFAWLYDEFSGAGALLSTGRISHVIKQYDVNGEEIDEDNEIQTIIYDTNISNITVGSKYIEVENTGTLDMEYSLAFSLEGTIDVSGLMYYRLYEVTDAVNSSTQGSYDSKLEAYATSHQPTSSMEEDTALPIRNMSLLNNLIKIDTLSSSGNGTSKKIYRFDYGMYRATNTSTIQNKSISVHMNAYSSQVGVITAENRNGQVWEVQNETQLREILNSAIAGDTIKLMDNINVNGSINIPKRIHFNANGFTLNITQDLIYEFVSIGELNIDVSGYGALNIGGDFILNTPKAEVTITGENNAYDIAVGGQIIVNALQDGESDGLYLNSVRIVKSTTSLVPADIMINSNTRLTIGPEVVLGFITAMEGTSNIEVVNNGYVTQMNFTGVAFLETYTKAQIYVYNLGEIYGVLGSYGILLPSDAEPYSYDEETSTYLGNTLVVKGITSGNITVGGSENFSSDDIQNNESDVHVLPIEEENNAYIIYIKSEPDSVQNLLEAYFTRQNSPNINQDIASIEKLIVWTLNAQYFEAEDFVYINSNAMPNIKYLSLYNSRVTDGTNQNTIPNNAFRNKTSLETVLLPRTLTTIGDYAFSGIELGKIPASNTEEFNTVSIPSSVTSIGQFAFDNSEYIKFESNIPPTIGSNAFGSNAKFFVINGTQELYKTVGGLPEDQVYINANLSDDRRYFVFETASGVGISYVINNQLYGSSLGIPDTITYHGSEKNVTEIGDNSFRKMNIINTNGVAVLMPDTVTRIDSHAFYGLRINSIPLTNVTYIADYAFYQTWLANVIANRAATIGNYAFYNSRIETLQLNNVNAIGNYAFANEEFLYEANVGTVTTIGDYAFYNCAQMQRFYFNNSTSQLVNNTETINLQVGESALFSNWGQYIDGRLRVYVPDRTLDSGKTVLSLYKDKFGSNSRYIYINGIDVGSYRYLGVNHNLSYYTVREVTLRNAANNEITGYEIISYQGPDLTANIPETIEINGETKYIISIGEGAYQNSEIANNSIVSIESSRLLKIAKNAFKGLDIDHVVASEVVTVETSAFEESGIHFAFLNKLFTLGDRAFYNCTDLYRLKLGSVMNIGNEAAANTSSLTSVFFNNTSRSANYSNSAFNNAGTNISNRFRMYVPDDDEMVSFYKGIYSNLATYIYPTGTIVGYYKYGSVNYNIGKYSVREVTKSDASGNDVTDYELIEYHGADINSDFELPSSVTPSTDALELLGYSYTSGQGTLDSNIQLSLTNIGDVTINDWQVDVLVQDGMTGISGNGVIAESHTTSDGTPYITFRSGTNYRNIVPGTTVTPTIHINTTSPSYDISVLSVRAVVNGASTYDIISIGDNAFTHVTSETGTAININSANLLYIGKGAFANLSGIKQVKLENVVTIDDSAFENSSITQGTFDNVNTIGDNAFKNARNLYKINFGKVRNMGASVITNANYLYQVVFEADDPLNLDIDNNVFSNIGSSTNDRLRFYVTNEVSSSGDAFVDIYKTHFPEQYREYFYAYDNIVGSYIPTGIADEIDIGAYSVKDITMNGTRGYEIVEYHGAAIDSEYEFPSLLSLNENELSAELIYISDWGNNPRTTSVTINVHNNSAVEQRTWRVVLDLEGSGTIVSASTWNNTAQINGNLLTLTNVNNNERIPAGGTVTFNMHIVHTGVQLVHRIRSVRLNQSSEDELPVISIGNQAYSHASFSGNASYDINSTHLLNIGESAFENNSALINISAPNCTNISDNAFRNATNLKTAAFNELVTLGDYAFYNDSSLVTLDLGKVEEMGEYALGNTTRIARLTFRNDEYASAADKMDIDIKSTTFQNTATTIGNRLRIYVPSGEVEGGSKTYVEAYADTLPESMGNYIYVTGTVYGEYIYEGVNIGEYSAMQASMGAANTLEIIEYHGADVNASFAIPDFVVDGDTTKYIISIGPKAYYFVNVTSGYTWNLQLPSSIINVGERAFYTRAMTTLTGNNLTYIGPYAFYQSPNLTTVAFNSVRTVDQYAFYRCLRLSTVNLGTGVQNIENYAFYASYSESNLTRMIVNVATPPTVYQYSLPGYSWFWGSDLYVRVPRNCRSAYRNADYWGNHNIEEMTNTASNFVYEIVNGNLRLIEYIGGDNHVVIPNTMTISGSTYNVTELAPTIFSGVSSTTRVTIGANVTNIGNGFLRGNTSINRIYVDSANPYFDRDDNYVLFSKDFETLIKYPNGKTSRSYEIPAGTKVVASGAFSNNAILSSVTFNSDILAISESAFQNSSLNTVTFTNVLPPYLTGFEFLPLNAGLKIYVPYDNGVNRYSNDTYFAWYSTYLRES